MKGGFSWVAFARGVGGVLVLVAIWEVFARSGMYSTAMTPPVEIDRRHHVGDAG